LGYEKRAPELGGECFNLTHAWNKHKRRFTDRQIAIAVEVLSIKAWVEKMERGGIRPS
jgi:hypothetical protein